MDMDVGSPSHLEAACCHPRGFTLIELLVAVAIGATLLVMAAPSFSELILNNRLTGHLNQLVSHIHYARSEAIRRGKRAMICISSDGTNCSNVSHWEEGWIIFIDSDGDRQRGPAEPILLVQHTLEKVTISYGAFPYYSRHFILYYPDGRSLGNGTFTFCDKRGEDSAKALVLYKSGRIRNTRTMPDGSELSCPPG